MTQEQGKVPSGVMSVIISLCSNWSKTNRITILTNKTYCSTDHLKTQLSFRNDFVFHSLPFIIPAEYTYIINRSILNKILNKSAKILLRIFSVFHALYVIIYLKQYLIDNKIQGVISHNGGWPGGELNRWVVFAAKLAGIKKNYIVVHNTPANMKWYVFPLNYIRSCLTVWSCKGIITVSNACKESLETEASLGANIRVIHNGMDIVKVRDVHVSNTSFNWKKTFNTIGFVGHLHHRKGVHVLFEAMEKLDAPCELLVIGNGDLDYTNQLKVKAQNIDYPVHFIGYCRDVFQVYPYLDILVLPSLYSESFGIVILEAMYFNIPVICSDFGGMKEVVEDNVTGFVVPSNNATALAVAVGRLLKDKTKSRKMGMAGRERLERLFSAEYMTHNYESLFD